MFTKLCAFGTPEEITQALAAGADVNARDWERGTALMEAARDNSLDVVRTLLDAGAEVNARNAEGRTPLMAAGHNLADVVSALLDAGADKSLKDNDGHDALWHAHESIRDGVRQQRITDPAEREAEEREIIRLLEAEP